MNDKVSRVYVSLKPCLKEYWLELNYLYNLSNFLTTCVLLFRFLLIGREIQGGPGTEYTRVGLYGRCRHIGIHSLGESTCNGEKSGTGKNGPFSAVAFKSSLLQSLISCFFMTLVPRSSYKFSPFSRTYFSF